jgi:chromosome segregation ATPase
MAVDVEKRKSYNTIWRRNNRAKKKAANGSNGDNDFTSSANSIDSTSSTANADLDAFGFPIGTHDAQGRKLGQLDDLEAERDKLTSELETCEKKREALEKEKRTVPLLTASDTLKQEIDTRAHLIAINELIKESDVKITALKDAIDVKNDRIKHLASEYQTLKLNRDEVSKGGRVYKDKMAYAAVILREEKQKAGAAKATLEKEGLSSDWRIKLDIANKNVATYSNTEGWLNDERQRYDDLMKLYRH